MSCLNAVVRKRRPRFSISPDTHGAGIHLLPSTLVFNNVALTPVFRFHGGDASTGGWSSTDGNALSYSSNTAAPDFGVTTPFTSAIDLAVAFNNGKVYQGGAGDVFGDIGTEDFIIEAFVRPIATGSSQRLIGTQKDSSSTGWGITFHSSGVFIFSGRDASNQSSVLYSSTVDTAWSYLLIGCDRSENSSNGIIGYLNESKLLSDNFSGRSGALDGSSPLTIGSFGDFTSKCASGTALGYVALYKRAALFPGGSANATLMTSLVEERHRRLTGHWFDGLGTKNPSSYSRASSAYVEKSESAVKKYRFVASGHLRVLSRLDASSTLRKGFFSEPAATNALVQSNNQATSWSIISLTVTVTANAATSPDGLSNATRIVEADIPASAHWIAQFGKSPETAIVIYSVYFKKGGSASRNWVGLHIFRTTPAVAHFAYFDIANGVVGSSSGTGALGIGIESCGDGWYRCWMRTDCSDTSALGGNYILIAEADSDITFSGDSATYADGILTWGAQMEADNAWQRPTSPIRTTTAAATRAVESLRYKGDDGNIGGVGSDKKGRMRVGVLLPNENLLATSAIASLNDGGSTSDRIELTASATNDTAILTSRATGGNDGDVTGSSDIADGVHTTLEARWGANDLRLFVDGAQEGSTDTSCDMPDELDRIDVGSTPGGASQAGLLVTDMKIWRSR